MKIVLRYHPHETEPKWRMIPMLLNARMNKNKPHSTKYWHNWMCRGCFVPVVTQLIREYENKT